MPQAQPKPAEYVFSRKQIFWAMTAIFAVYGALAFSLQTLTIARPKMAADLNGMSLYAWSVSIPSLVSAFVTLIFGKFSDIYGRRIMLLISLVSMLIGTVLAALSPSFIFLIAVSVLIAVGTGAMMPLVFAVVGDMFPPEKRSKWIGLLNIPMGFFALIGPALGGWFVDNLSWRYIYWSLLPLLAFCLITVPIGVPSIVSRGLKRKIDVLGCIYVAIASSATIVGFSFAGDRYPWGSPQVLGLLGVALIFWILFFYAENGAEEPILDPLVLRNRTFFTVVVSSFFSFFGQMAIMMYFPMFLQGVQEIRSTTSGWIIAPYSVLTAFIGVPVGFLLTRSKRFKWMYLLGYGILTAGMFWIVSFGAQTPVWWSVVAACLAGLGLGAIPTVNTMVVQNAVPKRLLGVAMGATFFVLLMGVAISPALLGPAMNATYRKTLSDSLPREFRQIANGSTMASLADPRALLSETALADLEKFCVAQGDGGRFLFNQTKEAIRTSMEAGLRRVFWIGAITMLIAFLLISTIPARLQVAKEEIPEPVSHATRVK